MTDEHDPLTDTQVVANEHRVLRKYFGDAWRAWHWLRRQFSATSLGVIGVILVGGGGYILRLQGVIGAQGTRITVLETQVVPVLKDEATVTKLENSVSVLATKIDAAISNHEGRIKRVEDNLDLDYLDRVKADREAKQQRRKHR